MLPGTTHVTIVSRADLLLPMITPFLDAPMPEAKWRIPNLDLTDQFFAAYGNRDLDALRDVLAAAS